MALEADGGASGLVRQVQSELGNVAAAASFVPLLYGRKGLPDLPGLPADWRAATARHALEFIASRPKGRHKVRIRSAAVNGSTSNGALIEIVNDDMPFLVDSVLGELQARGIGVRLLLHPIFKTRRDKAGRLQDIAPVGDDKLSDAHQESYIAVHIKPVSETQARDLVDTLSAILEEVRIVVADWKPMLERLAAAVRQLQMAPDSVPREELAESVAFLEWLGEDNFTFLGSRELELEGNAESGDLAPMEGSGLGVLRDASVQVLRRGTE